MTMYTYIVVDWYVLLRERVKLGAKEYVPQELLILWALKSNDIRFKKIHKFYSNGSHNVSLQWDFLDICQESYA
jgi:hypothetical protein